MKSYWMVMHHETTVLDQKSTRLNSSHVRTSYAVFCLQDPATPDTYTLTLHDALPIYDHNNYYAFDLEGIMLTYGKVSGYNAYGKGTRGGRIITYQNGQIISNEIVLDGDAS